MGRLNRAICGVRKGLGLGMVVLALAATAHAAPGFPTPEIDPGTMASGLTLLVGGLLLFKDRIRRK